MKKIWSYFTLSLLLLLSNSSGNYASQLPGKSLERPTGTLEKMIVARGSVAMDLDLNRLRGIDSKTRESKLDTFRFEVGTDSFFTILVFNRVLRGPGVGSIGLIWKNSAVLPEPLNASANQLVVEKLPASEPSNLVVRDGKTGFVFFTIAGHLYEYNAAAHLLDIKDGRLLISRAFAHELGRPADAGMIVGKISIATTVYPVEVTTVVNGEAKSAILPPRRSTPQNAPDTAQGPDIIVGDLPDLGQYGAGGSQVGLGLGTTSCNNGNVEVDWFQLPETDHCVIPQNLYRMSGGTNNNDRFEQVGQSWMKHAFFALQDDACGFGCVPAANGTHLGVGCSDPYDGSLNAAQDFLGSRAWVNPFTGVFPSTAAGHAGHVHTGQSHMIIVELNDLNTTLNQGAKYYAEAQYVTPQEYAWCQTHAGQCNMYNNGSYRQFSVNGTTNFTFSPIGSTVRMTPAINAWAGATIKTIEPEPGGDGRAFIAYKVTGPSGGVWRYEYAIFNQNLDRGIQSFSLPVGCGLGQPGNLGFHAPPQHPGWANDGTPGDAGYSSTPWTAQVSAVAASWNTETFAQNPNANAIRWGTLYNFRFETGTPPQAATATISFFKTGAPISVAVQGPSSECLPTPTPTATATATSTATATATGTPAATATPTPSATVTPSATPVGTATPSPTIAPQPVNLSTRMRVQTDAEVSIGGFISTGTAPKHLLLRAIGPSLSQFGVQNVLADPVMELHGVGGFVTITNDNWRDDPVQEALIIASGIAPTNNLEAAIDATLDPGPYTAIVRGKSNTSGVALVEVYDLSQAVPAKLANMSTRAFVSTGTNIVIAGFILGGNSSTDRIVVRGIGPSLTAGGVPNALADPILELRDGDGALLMANNDWQDNPTQAAEVTAAGLAPASNLESAIATTLSPGRYTALLAGRNDGTGVGLVEVYDLGSP